MTGSTPAANSSLFSSLQERVPRKLKIMASTEPSSVGGGPNGRAHVVQHHCYHRDKVGGELHIADERNLLARTTHAERMYHCACASFTIQLDGAHPRFYAGRHRPSVLPRCEKKATRAPS